MELSHSDFLRMTSQGLCVISVAGLFSIHNQLELENSFKETIHSRNLHLPAMEYDSKKLPTYFTEKEAQWVKQRHAVLAFGLFFFLIIEQIMLKVSYESSCIQPLSFKGDKKLERLDGLLPKHNQGS